MSPYFEHWKRGRPSKAALEKRAKHFAWMKENIKQFPMLEYLLNDSVKFPYTNENGKPMIKYIPR